MVLMFNAQQLTRSIEDKENITVCVCVYNGVCVTVCMQSMDSFYYKQCLKH